MGQATVRNGWDTWASEKDPEERHGSATTLTLRTGTGLLSHAFVLVKSPVPAGATVLSATLRGRLGSGWEGRTSTITATPLAEDWTPWRVKWTDRPATDSGPVTATVVNGESGDLVEFDVTARVQSIANGAANYGWRFHTDNPTTARLRAFNHEAESWELAVEWSDIVPEPTGLKPSSGYIGQAKPTLTYQYDDVNGDTSLAAHRFELDNGTTIYDTGELLTTEPELDTATTAFTGFVEGVEGRWRVYAKEEGGEWSDPSAWATVTYEPHLTMPTLPTVVWDSTPILTFTVTGGTLAKYRIVITNGGNKSKVRYDSKVQTTSDATFTHAIPEKYKGTRVLPGDGPYWLHVTLWDSLASERSEAANDPTYVEAWSQFTVDESLAETVPTNLTVTAVDDTPLVRLQWTRAAAPDSWEILCEDKVVHKVSVEDTFVSGTTYAFESDRATPFEEQKWKVRAVTDGKASQGPVTYYTSQAEGVWLQLDDHLVRFDGDDLNSWKRADRRVTYHPLNSDHGVDLVVSLGGLAGEFAGTFSEASDQSVADAISALKAIKLRPVADVRLWGANVNIPATLRNLSWAPAPDFRPDTRRQRVSFEFEQSGEIDYEE